MFLGCPPNVPGRGGISMTLFSTNFIERVKGLGHGFRNQSGPGIEINNVYVSC